MIHHPDIISFSGTMIKSRLRNSHHGDRWQGRKIQQHFPWDTGRPFPLFIGQQCRHKERKVIARRTLRNLYHFCRIYDFGTNIKTNSYFLDLLRLKCDFLSHIRFYLQLSDIDKRDDRLSCFHILIFFNIYFPYISVKRGDQPCIFEFIDGCFISRSGRSIVCMRFFIGTGR